MNFEMIVQLDSNCNVTRTCQYDSLRLLGKTFPEDNKILTFLNNEKYIPDFLAMGASGVICTGAIADLLKDEYDGGICVADNPKTTFFKLHNHLAKATTFYGKKKPTYVSGKASVHGTAIIDDHDVVIEDNVYIGANVVVHSKSIIKKGSIVRDGSVIGAPAFYYFDESNLKMLVTSAGGVLLEEDSEIHSNTVIEKGVLGGDTIIGRNTKIDNMILVGHDSHIGENCIVAAGTSFAGGVLLGANSFVGLAAAFSPNVKVGKNTKISIGAVVTKDVPDNTQVSGNFAIEHALFIENIKSLSKKE